MSQPQQSLHKIKKQTKQIAAAYAQAQQQQQALPTDIHSLLMSPQVGVSKEKAHQLSMMNTSHMSSTQDSHGRGIQTVGRDHEAKLRTQRSTSRSNNLRDVRGVRTDRRGMEEELQLRQDRALSGSDGPRGQMQEREREERNEEHQHMQGRTDATNRFEGTINFNRQQLNSIRDNNSYGKFDLAHQMLRESHNSVKSIQKQRIQRSLQKSQDGRKKLEEKLEALSNQERLAQGHGLGGANVSGTNASNNMGGTAQEGLREKLGGFDGKSGALSTVSSSGGLLSSNQYSIRGTSSSSGMKVKDINQYKDQMLANMSKMKSLRETGEFEMSQISSAMNSIHNASMSGASDANLDTAPSHDHYQQSAMQLRSSDQVLMAEPNIDNQRDYRNQDSRSLNQSRASSSYQSVHHYQQNQNDSVDHLNGLSNFQSNKSLSQLTSKTMRTAMNMNSTMPKMYASIVEAQPVLKSCLITSGFAGLSVANDSGQFASLLSAANSEAVDIDKNVLCPKCANIVVNAVECQSCQYIICQGCAQQLNNVCDEQDCGDTFTQTPGKIHKLYKEKLHQLEFKCPNHPHGCAKTVSYDQLDNHLQRHCEARLHHCPNKCSKTQKFTQFELQKHLEEDCPKECLPCPQCKQIKFRMEIAEHLETTCDKVLVKCDICGQSDLRIVFKSNKHECASDSERDQPQSRKNTELMYEQHIRSIRDFQDSNLQSRSAQGRASVEAAEYTNERYQMEQSLANAPHVQIKVLKADISSVSKLITEDVFQMIDNLSQALTEKDSEVNELKERIFNQESKLQKQREDITAFEERQDTHQKEHQALQSTLVQQSEHYSETLTNLRSRQAQQTKSSEEIQQQLLQKIHNQNQKFSDYEIKYERLNQLVIKQQDQFGEILQQFNEKIERQARELRHQSDLIARLQDELAKRPDNRQDATLLQRLREDFDALAERTREKERAQERTVERMRQEQEKSIKTITEVQVRQVDEFEKMQKQFGEQLQRIQQNQEYAQHSDAAHQSGAKSSSRKRIPPLKTQNFIDDEPKLQESLVSESLDEEIYREHYQNVMKQKNEGEKSGGFQRNLLVPPIDLNNHGKTSGSRGKKSPKSQKQYTEDVQAVHGQHGARAGAQVTPSMFYPDARAALEEEESSRLSKQEDSASRLQRSRLKASKPIQDPNSQKSLTKSRHTKVKEMSEIDDDVDESQFIPAYLSQTENDGTDLNQTELMTDFNTARPLLNMADSAATNSKTLFKSGGANSGRNSARNTARDATDDKKSAQYFNTVPVPAAAQGAGGLTERGKAAEQMGVNSGAGSGMENSDDSSLKISQSTQQKQHSQAETKTELEESKGPTQTPSIDLVQNLDSLIGKIEDVQVEKPVTSTHEMSARQYPQKMQPHHIDRSQADMVRQSVKSVSLIHKTDSDNMSFQNESEATNLERQSFDPQRESHSEFKAILGQKIYEQDSQADNRKMEELRPSQLLEKKPQLQPQLEQIKEEPRVSNPRRCSNPYNENLTKTYESSEFEQACPDILPGMIFGANKADGAELPGAVYTGFPRQCEGQPQPSLQSSQLSKASPRNPSQAYLKQISSPATPMSGQSLGSLNVNFDQNLNKFYALAQSSGLGLNQQSSSQGPTEANQTGDATRLQAQADPRIPEHDHRPGADEEGSHYAHIESLLASGQAVDVRHQTLKAKNDAVNLLEESSQKAQQAEIRQIEKDINELQEKYQKTREDTANAREEVVEKRTMDSTQERRKNALRALEKSDGNDLTTGKKAAPGHIGRQNAFSDSNSEFERDEAMNGQNIDNIINNILEGDDLFKDKSKQLNATQANVSKQQLELNNQTPFDLNSSQHQSNIDQQSSMKAPNIDLDAEKQVRKSMPEHRKANDSISHGRKKSRDQMSSGSKGRRSRGSSKHSRGSAKHSQQQEQAEQEDKFPVDGLYEDDDLDYDNEGRLNPNQPIPTGLESDLETILETDQESNFMTTARTNRQKSAAPSQPSSQAYGSNVYSLSGASGAGLPCQMPSSDKESSVVRNISKQAEPVTGADQSLNQSSLSSSFALPEPTLPQNLYQSSEPLRSGRQVVPNYRDAIDRDLPEIDLKMPEDSGKKPARVDGDPFAGDALSPHREVEDPSLINFQSKEKPPQDSRVTGVSQSLNSMSDISPIARAIGEDASQYQESRYTNILDSNARSIRDMRIGDSDKPSEQRKMNPYKQKPTLLEAIGSPAASLDDPSFLISDRSINIPDIKQVADILARPHKPVTQPPREERQLSPRAQEEQRIRQLDEYHDKVRSAVAHQAQRKIQQQQDAFYMVEADKVQTNKSLLQSAQRRRAAELGGPSGATPQPDQRLDRDYDAEVVQKELSMIKEKHRMAQAAKQATMNQPENQLDRSDLDQDGYF